MTKIKDAEVHDGHWTLIGQFAIQTKSITEAASVARTLQSAKVRTRQKGRVRGVRWMCLARFHDAFNYPPFPKETN